MYLRLGHLYCVMKGQALKQAPYKKYAFDTVSGGARRDELKSRAELWFAKTPERQGRVSDHDTSASMEKKKQEDTSDGT